MDDERHDSIAETHSANEPGHREQALPHSEAHLRAMFDAVDDAVHIVDHDLRIVFVNDRFRRWAAHFGITDSVLGKTLHEVFPFLPDSVHSCYHAPFEPGSVRTHQTSLDLGHSIAHLDIRLVPVEEQGEVTHIVTVIRDLTAHRQTIEALEESEHRYRDLVEQSPLGILIHMEHTIVFANPRAAEILDYDSPDELVGTDILSVVHSDYHDVVATRIQQVYAQHGAVPLLEQVYCSKNGTPVDVEAGATPIRFEGKPASQVTFRDISSNKEAQRERDAQRRMLRSVIDTSPDLISFRDLDLKYRLANLAFLDFIGLAENQVIGEIDLGIRTANTEAERTAENRRVIEEGITLRYQQQYSAGQHQDVPFDLIKTPLRDEEGRIIGILNVARDIAERERTERALRESELRYRLLAETAGDIILTHDLDGRITYINPAGLAMCGYNQHEARNFTLTDVVVSRHLPLILEDLSQRKAGDIGRHRFEIEFATKNGRIIPLEAVSSPIICDGEPLTILVIARDLTHRKRLEGQLQQAQKMETVGRLAGGVAHDFNNLLTTITGYSHFVKMSLAPDDPAMADIYEVLKATERATRLTKQLLAFSRRQIISPRLLDMNELLIDMGKMLRRLIGEHIEMVILPTANETTIKADPSQIEQVIINLAVNARDAMPGGGTLIIRTANVAITENAVRPGLDIEPGQYVVMTVSDTGIGMDEEVRAHLFEPFFTTKGVGEGTGLGLATVYGIVKQHGGGHRHP